MEPRLFCHELIHFFLTGLIATVLFWRFRHPKLIIICLLTGIFIDIDHLFDFLVYSGVGVNILKMFSMDYFQHAQKAYILFHGWELIPFLWLGGKYLNKRLKLKGFEWAFFLPYLGHLLIDQFLSGYTRNPLAYFLIYRILIKFDLTKFNNL